jgi:hypothetical protein
VLNQEDTWLSNADPYQSLEKFENFSWLKSRPVVSVAQVWATPKEAFSHNRKS